MVLFYINTAVIEVSLYKLLFYNTIASFKGYSSKTLEIVTKYILEVIIYYQVLSILVELYIQVVYKVLLYYRLYVYSILLLFYLGYPIYIYIKSQYLERFRLQIKYTQNVIREYLPAGSKLVQRTRGLLTVTQGRPYSRVSLVLSIRIYSSSGGVRRLG